jgi:predicted nucleic acid-binding protein
VSNAFGGLALLIDKSAWERQQHPAIAAEWETAVAADQLMTCSVTEYEILFSTQDANRFDLLQERLGGFRRLPMTDTVHRAGLRALRDLAHKAPLHHRIKLPDLLIAACAQEAGVDVLHYDRDFDRLAQVLAFESRWLAPPGSLD